MNRIESEEATILPRFRLSTLALVLDEGIAKRETSIVGKLPKAGEVRRFEQPEKAIDRFAPKAEVNKFPWE